MAVDCSYRLPLPISTSSQAFINTRVPSLLDSSIFLNNKGTTTTQRGPSDHSANLAGSISMGLSSFLSPPQSPFEPPAASYALLANPIQFLLSPIHKVLVHLRGPIIPKLSNPIRVLCISDTHTNTPDLPPADLIIHAGDLTNEGTVSEIQAQFDWLASLPYKHKVAIAGNHDSYFDPRSRRPIDTDKSIDFKGVHYLQHSSITLNFPEKGDRKLRLFGAPQIPACGGSDFAFQYQREDDAWSGTLPLDLDVLVTHTPPKWHLDLPAGLGCQYLLQEIWKVRPHLHVFGHVHEGRGTKGVFWDEAEKAYERMCACQSWVDLLWFGIWLDVMRVLIYDVVGIIWTRVWGAEVDGTVMVNSALVDWKGRLSFQGQIIDI